MPYTDDDIRQVYLEEMGRAPSDAELSGLRRFSGTGFVDLNAPDAAAIAMGGPNARLQQLQRYGGMYEQNLAGSDNRILQQAQDQIGSTFAQQGRQSGGSAYVAAFANAARDLAMHDFEVLAPAKGELRSAQQHNGVTG